MARSILFASFLLSVALPGAAQTSDFQWSGAVARGKTIEIKGVNGSIHAELAPGNQVEVRASKHSRRSDIDSVKIETVQENGNVTICAVYPNEGGPGWQGRRGRDRQPNECRVGDAGHISSNDNDVVVDFVVRVPAGVQFAGKTVNGGVDARGLKGRADARTVNGRIDLSTTDIGSAETVNGSIDASLGKADWEGRTEFTAVNGSITLRLPKGADTNLRASMTNGSFSSDFPVSVTELGRHNRRVIGTIGKGGRDLNIQTVNGSISLRFVTR